MDRETFGRHVRAALAHLDDLASLEGNHLAFLLSPAGSSLSGVQLRQALVEIMEELKPHPESSDQAAGRRYRHLLMRYVQGHSLESVARLSDVSVRQARRDHDSAVQSVVSLLWTRHQRLAEPHSPLLAEGTGSLEASGESTGSESLDAELTKIGATPPGSTAPGAVLDDVLATIARLGGMHGITFAASLPDTLAPVAVDVVPLRQILLNLLKYAVGLRDGTRITITAADAPETIDLQILVESPPGADDAPWGGDRDTPAQHALLGIGRRLAELQGCKLEVVASGPGRIALNLGLPVVQTALILVIDDNPDLVRLFRRFLKGRPYRLIQASNVHRAIRLAQELHPNLVILDVLMPTMDGWQIFRELSSRSQTEDIPVVVCSVLPERELALSLGAAAFLAKPVSQQSLLEALSHHVVAGPAESPE